MNSTTLHTLCAGIVAALAMMMAPLAYAQTSEALEVKFNGISSSTAMFGETNFLPGDSVTRTAHVTNHGAETETVHTDTIFESDPNGLGDHMTLIITDNKTGTTWYNNSFGNFLGGGEVSLGTILPGETIVYAYTVIFKEETGNDMQEKSLSFDVCVGFASEQGYVCGTQISDGEDDDGDDGDGGSSNGGGGGPGGGGIIESSPLHIQNERVDGVTTPSPTAIGNPDGTAVIRWETYRNGHLEPSTSQVIYGLKTHGNGTQAGTYPYSINLTQMNFGYPLATVEDSAMVTHHAMTLTGLEVGGTYVYRVVSHASPATVSYEHAFTIPYGNGAEEGDANGGDEGYGMGGDDTILLTDGGTTSGAGGVSSGDRGGEEESGNVDEHDDGNAQAPTILNGITQNGLGNLLGAALGSLPAWLQGPLTCAFWFIFIILIILAIQRLYRAYTKKQGAYDPRVEKDILLWMILDLLAVIVLLFIPYYCPIIPLALLFVGLAFWYVWRTRPWVKK